LHIIGQTFRSILQLALGQIYPRLVMILRLVNTYLLQFLTNLTLNASSNMVTYAEKHSKINARADPFLGVYRQNTP